MTEPSDKAKRKACELVNAHVSLGDGLYYVSDVYLGKPTLYALALYIDEVDKTVREIAGLSNTQEGVRRGALLRSLMLPDEPDPLAEAISAWGKHLDAHGGAAVIRAELEKRGLAIVEKGND